MTASRISVALLVLALSASGTPAEGDNDHATAPPRQLSVPGAERAPEVSTDGLKDDEQETAPPENPASHPVDGGPPDVSTEGLLDDNEDLPTQAPDPGPKPLPVTVEPAAPIVAKPEKVEVGTLGMVDGSAVGLLDLGNGGFESNMWSGSSRDDIEQLLIKAPLSSPDSAVRSLARRIVLSRADAPPGPVKRALISIRIEKLLGAGMIDEAGALAASAELKDDPDFARVQANALLLSGRVNDVCSDKTASRLTESDLFWLQLRAYCATASGDTATADITRNVIDAQGQTDASYDTLVEDAVTGAKKPAGKIANPTAVHFFLLRKAGLPIADDTFARFGPVASIVTMRDLHNSPAIRLAAAERVLKTGAASNADLKAVVDAQNIPADQTANALAAASKLSFLGAQALLRRAALLEPRPAEKVALLHEALMLGDKAGLFEVSSNLQAAAAVSVKAGDVPQSDGPLIGWALLLAGKPAAAEAWLGDNDVARAVLGLSTGKDDAAQASLSNIAKHLAAGSSKIYDATRPMEALLLGLYDALGHAMPADAKVEAAAIRAEHFPGRRPDDALMQKMQLAAASPDRKGEAILRVLDIIGSKGPGGLASDVTVEIVRALDEMGVKDAARAVALHGLLLYRPGTV